MSESGCKWKDFFFKLLSLTHSLAAFSVSRRAASLRRACSRSPCCKFCSCCTSDNSPFSLLSFSREPHKQTHLTSSPFEKPRLTQVLDTCSNKEGRCNIQCKHPSCPQNQRSLSLQVADYLSSGIMETGLTPATTPTQPGEAGSIHRPRCLESPDPQERASPYMHTLSKPSPSSFVPILLSVPSDYHGITPRRHSWICGSA